MNSDSKPEIWTAADITDVLGVAAIAPWSATGVSIDSRSVESGDLFVAIVGPTFDGHDFVENAVQNGAVGAIVHRDPGHLTDDAAIAAKMIQVTDTLHALEMLAAHARERSAAKIVAVTGSVGKTGSKEILKLLLSDQGRTSVSEGNLNNHWGLPLSLSRMPENTEFGVFEMGMNHAGEIRPLSLIAKPDVSLITTVEQVHSEFFSSVEQIAESKAEIFAGLKPGGAAVLNADNPMFDYLNATARLSPDVSIKTFGYNVDADFRLLSVTQGNASSQVDARIDGRPISLEIGIPGRHWAMNAMGVLACVAAVGADVEQAAAKLKDMHGLKGRGELHSIEIEGGEFVLIDESYNASPVSMAAAVDVLGQMFVSGSGRRIVVLGDMLELGEDAEKLHRDLSGPLKENGIDLVFTAGQYMADLWDALPANMRGGHAMISRKLSPLVTGVIRPGDIVSVKGSLGSKMGVIVGDLMDMGNRDAHNKSQIVNGN